MSDEPIGKRKSKFENRQSAIGNPKSGNGVATAEDFRKLAEELTQPMRVVLPKSGLAVLLRPPNTLRVLLVSDRLESLADSSSTPEERREYVELLARLVTDVMVDPKLSLAPRDGELDPRWLAPEDAEFLLKWALGALTPDGADLSGFFRADP